MLITESQLGFNRSVDSLDLLDKMNYLTEAESVYSPALVPIVENSNVGAHLVRLEDMISFSEANGIEDLGYALSLVCESSNVDPQTVAFTVQEETIIADESIADLTKGIMEAGVSVIAKPLNENNPMGILTDVAMNYLVETGDSYLLECLCEDPLALAEGWLNEGTVKQKMTKKDQELANMMAAGREKAAEERVRNEGIAARRADVAKRREKMDKENQDPRVAARRLFALAQQGQKSESQSAKDTAPATSGASSVPSTPAQAESFLDKVKRYGNKGRDAIAAIIAKLHKWAAGINYKIQNDPEQKGVWATIKQKITAAIQFLTAKLHNAVASKDRANLAAKASDYNGSDYTL